MRAERRILHGPTLASPVFMYRRVQEYLTAQRKTALDFLDQDWGDGRSRFFNPPVYLMAMTLLKIAREGGRGILELPDCLNQM